MIKLDEFIMKFLEHLDLICVIKMRLSFQDLFEDKVFKMALLLVNLVIDLLNHFFKNNVHRLFDSFLYFLLNNRLHVIVIIIVVFELARSRPAFFGALLEGSVPVDADQALRRVT